jgi:hypothetical protein
MPDMSTMIWYIYNEYLKKNRDKMKRKNSQKGLESNKKTNDTDSEDIDD